MALDFLVSVPGKVNKLLNRLTAARAANLDNCDSPVSECAKTSDSRFNNLTRLDTTVSSRLAAADYKPSPIKSIQRGSFTFTAGSSGNVSISSVNTSKTMVKSSVKFGSAYYNSSDGFSLALGCGIRLANSTTLSYSATVDPASVSHSTGTCYWEVIEFN